jgi:hypothetical protein
MRPDYYYYDVGHYYCYSYCRSGAEAHDRDGYSADGGCDHSADGCTGGTTLTRSRPHTTTTTAKTATGALAAGTACFCPDDRC